MQNFDFITGTQFRESLELDYSEMMRCFDGRAWKSVQVLAGSIVEALLIDYLLATNDPPRGGKHPLKMDLADAVNVCKAEGVLSERTADLSSVVRSYRNLIHPGRTVRLDEAQPSENSAKIALALVDLIVEEVAKRRLASFGLTGEQIVSKIERDSNSLLLLRHLLSEVSMQQRERLLLDLIPNRYFEVDGDDSPPDFGLMSQLEKAFRIVFDTVPDDVKQKVAGKFVQILREADGDRVLSYGAAFFRPADLTHVSPSHLPLVKQHLYARMAPALDSDDIDYIRGVEAYLSTDEVTLWLDPIVRTLISATAPESMKSAVHDYLIDSASRTPDSKVEELIEKRLIEWERHLKNQSRLDDADVIHGALSDYNVNRLPF